MTTESQSASLTAEPAAVFAWRVLRVWEHELARKNEARLIRHLSTFIGS
jgi:hypothetical protein